MNEQYARWIAENVKNKGYGECAKVTIDMVAVFPELTRVRGHYYCWIWGPRTHWWCVTADGEIVDPTSAQFPSGGKGEYEVLPPDYKEPTGMCPECGGHCYDGETFCSENCGIAYVAYCNSFCR